MQNLDFSSSDAVDCYVYGAVVRSMNVSGMIIDQKIRSTLSENCHSAKCRQQAPCGLSCDAHRSNAYR